MKRISKITGKILSEKNLAKAAEAAFVCNIAKKKIKEIFSDDKDFLREIKINSYSKERKILYIGVSSSFYSQEIRLREKELVVAINERLEKDMVEKVLYKSI